ncbi:protein kinase PINOID 2 [Dendrobium catenatum]|uniref:non-specific serine/threonine protein kinase n=1 Tax=Dendrobium catenatum TaxID=906689 RepID=A0A2I0WBE2_9ASPA|nr:protein kinase PINOID 2 [Dendrobium catenatum]PKU72985.1 Protein kinase PINOID 2 [Dendrobium catenatum]
MDSDHESSASSSFTAVESRYSRFSDFSSLSSFRSSSPSPSKPHKSNQIEWEAIKSLRSTASSGIRLDHFRLVRRLGSGDLGNVYLCQLRDDPRYSSCLYAMKVVDREALAVRKKLRRAETEKEILRSLDHPFLPTLYAEFEAHHYSCLVMEFCPGGDLYVARQRQPERRFTVASAKFYAAETILALEYLHMMGVVYRDLKPENVLVRDDGHIMLSDFDLSFKCVVVPRLLRAPLTVNSSIKTTPSSCVPPPMQPVISCFYGGRAGRIGGAHKVKVKPKLSHVGTTLAVPTGEANIKEESQEVGQFFHTELVAEPITARSKSFVGTHEYLAPEVISGIGHGGAVDWWTLGVFLYEMIYGKTPFKGENNEKTIMNIMKQQLSFPKVEGLKDMEELLRAQDLISKLLVKNPKKRIGSLKGSVEIKRHEFFKGVNWALIRSVKPPEVPKDQRSALLKRNSKVVMSKLSKKERDEPFQIPQYFDYF